MRCEYCGSKECQPIPGYGYVCEYCFQSLIEEDLYNDGM